MWWRRKRGREGGKKGGTGELIIQVKLDLNRSREARLPFHTTPLLVPALLVLLVLVLLPLLLLWLLTFVQVGSCRREVPEACVNSAVHHFVYPGQGGTARGRGGGRGGAFHLGVGETEMLAMHLFYHGGVDGWMTGKVLCVRVYVPRFPLISHALPAYLCVHTPLITRPRHALHTRIVEHRHAKN